MSTMIDPEDASYTCTLTPESLEIAKRELFEDPKQRLGAVQTLRKWIREQPHFTSRTDTYFLLAVLRTAKFSQLRAREIIENILTMKTKLPKLMNNLNSYDPAVFAFLDHGVLVPLPKPDKEGRVVWLMKVANMDLNNELFSPDNEMRANLILDALFKDTDENIIVNGEIFVCDMTGFSAKHVARMTLANNSDSFKIFQDCMLGRFKGFHMYNAGVFFDVVLGVVKPFLKKKYLERTHVHNTMESLYELIPMDAWPDEYLPDDYTGPSAGPIAAINGKVKQRLLDPSFHARLLDHTADRYKIDATKKPTATQQASFRKLDTD